MLILIATALFSDHITEPYAASALLRDHAGAEGILRRADAPKERALVRIDPSLYHIAAPASHGVLGCGFRGFFVGPFHIKAFILRS
jgi:hypothetical protein